MEQQSNSQCETHVLLETVHKMNEKAPKRYKISKRFLKQLEQELKQSDGATVTDRTHRELVKKIIEPIENVKTLEQAEQRVSALDELINRDPGLAHTMMEIDTKYSRERKKRLQELFELFIRFGAKLAEEHIRKEVAELPAHEAGIALAHVGACLSLYCGEVDDVRGFVRWSFGMTVIEAKKLALIQSVYADGPLKKCIYAGILSQLETAKDLAPYHYKDKDDLFGEFIEYLLKEGALEFITSPATASDETRIRKFAERHTRFYVTSLIRQRECVKENKHKINYGVTFSENELLQIKAQERRAERGLD